ncbi:MAG: hypothetical protein K9M57_05585, partial [Phycisphaerae bacterium]|nr:hypothetical protein [Phycisphaerae bacterium]
MKRYLYLTLLVSLSCLFTLSVCGCDEESKGLSVEFKVGEKFSRKIHADSDLKMMFPNADKKTADMVLDFHVKSVDPEGVSTIEVTIGSLKASVSTLGQVYIFDSEDPAASEKGTPGKVSQTKRFLDAFKGLKGEKYSAQVDATGKVTKLFEMSPRIKSVAYSSTHGDILGSDQVKMLLTESYLKEYVSPLFYSDLTRADITPELTWKGGGCVLVPDVPLVALQKSYQIK